MNRLIKKSINDILSIIFVTGFTIILAESSLSAQNQIIFSEDFDSNDLNWPTGSRENATYAIHSGKFHFEHLLPRSGRLVSNSIPIEFSENYGIESTITKIDGVDAGYGIIFGGADNSNIHVFVISARGYYRYSYYERGKHNEVVPWTRSLYIKEGNETNTFKVIVRGKSVKFYINDSEINQAPFQPFGNKLGFIVYQDQQIEVEYLHILGNSTQSNQRVETVIRTNDKPTSTFAADSLSRVALVIGNASYPNAPLKNAVNDARLVAKTLRNLGFEVISVTDASRKEMRDAIVNFGDRILKTKGVGLFYYAGHGLQSNGINYIVPVNAEIKRAYEIEDECIGTEMVMRMMTLYENPLNIIILDACRNNPYTRSFRGLERGLAQPRAAATGSIIAFATAPGMTASDGTGNNGLYTEELVKAMSTKGLTIEEVFKQVRISVSRISQGKQIPWENSSLMGDFYFYIGK